MAITTGDLKTQEIVTSTLTVKDNIIGFQNYFIQISNISEIGKAPIPKLGYPIPAIVFFIVGLVMLSAGIYGSPAMVITGLVLMAICVLFIFSTWKKNQNRGEVLIIGLNSGKRFYFRCYNKAFLSKVLNVLKSCVNSKNQNIMVDFSNSVITNSPIVSGSDNDIDVKVGV